MARSLQRHQVLGLYRQLLLHARRFPSIKRDSMVEDIRIGMGQQLRWARWNCACAPCNPTSAPRRHLTSFHRLAHPARPARTFAWPLSLRAEFRANARKTSPEQVAHSVELGLRGLQTMMKYTRLDPSAADWSVDLEQDPLGAGSRSSSGSSASVTTSAGQAAQQRAPLGTDAKAGAAGTPQPPGTPPSITIQAVGRG
jgi:hypothetical protein